MLTKERPSTSFDTESYRSSASRPKPKSSDTESPQYRRRPNNRQFLRRFEQRTRNVLQRGAFYNVFFPVRTWDVIPFDQTWRAVVVYNARSAARNMLLALGIQSGGYPC